MGRPNWAQWGEHDWLCDMPHVRRYVNEFIKVDGLGQFKS